MQKLHQLFSNFEPQVANRYLSRAINLLEQLNAGANYRVFGGRRLRQNRHYIRFKFGCYRLIFKCSLLGIEPCLLLHRKNLESLIKRRCS